MTNEFDGKGRWPSRYGRASLVAVAALVAVTVLACVSTASPEWGQWGGPNRNFQVDSKGLADKWPEDGPKKLWSRELGDGYSTILVDGDTLYTMYRAGETEFEFTIALDAKTGKTRWEHKNESPFTDLMKQYGPGPSSTPLIAGERLFSIGTNMVMHCFDKKSGKVHWKHDLVKEYGASVPGRGYCASPTAYKKIVIVTVDHPRDKEEGEPSGDDEAKVEPKKKAKRQTLFAFDQQSGQVVWRKQDLTFSHSSPVLIDVDGEAQMVLATARGLIGFNPETGDLLWQHPLVEGGAYISTPVWTGDELIYCSSAYEGGSHAFRLTKKDGKTTVEELWYSRKIRIHHGNAIRLGDYVYASSGDMGPAFLGAINIHTGKTAWRERGFSKANFVYGDSKAIILDEDGQLALATLSPEGLHILSKCTVAERYAWAAPTLAGTTLYIRDRKHIMAFDLAAR
ncbi:MAG: PQQ-like beta-propeller repeat protein [Planctomycetes bacterium]|nr:PQQ-like beta-propeller repeat protein [Planctomycetota bacterium]